MSCCIQCITCAGGTASRVLCEADFVIRQDVMCKLGGHLEKKTFSRFGKAEKLLRFLGANAPRVRVTVKPSCTATVEL